MASTPAYRKIYEIATDDLENLNQKQFGWQTALPTGEDMGELGYKPWGAKDTDDKVHYFCTQGENVIVDRLKTVSGKTAMVWDVNGEPNSMSLSANTVYGEGSTYSEWQNNYETSSCNLAVGMECLGSSVNRNTIALGQGAGAYSEAAPMNSPPDDIYDGNNVYIGIDSGRGRYSYEDIFIGDYAGRVYALDEDATKFNKHDSAFNIGIGSYVLEGNLTQGEAFNICFGNDVLKENVVGSILRTVGIGNNILSSTLDDENVYVVDNIFMGNNINYNDSNGYPSRLSDNIVLAPGSIGLSGIYPQYVTNNIVLATNGGIYPVPSTCISADSINQFNNKLAIAITTDIVKPLVTGEMVNYDTTIVQKMCVNGQLAVPKLSQTMERHVVTIDSVVTTPTIKTDLCSEYIIQFTGTGTITQINIPTLICTNTKTKITFLTTSTYVNLPTSAFKFVFTRSPLDNDLTPSGTLYVRSIKNVINNFSKTVQYEFILDVCTADAVGKNIFITVNELDGTLNSAGVAEGATFYIS